MNKVPFPSPELGDPLGLGEAGHTVAEGIEGLAGAKHVSNPLVQNKSMAWLHNEIGRAHFIGLGNRLNIVQPRHDKNRHNISTGQLTKALARGEAVHPGHLNIEDHDVGHAGGGEVNGRLAGSHLLQA